MPGTGFLANQSSAAQFGDFLWGAFGPVMTSWAAAEQPRPFGDAVVDGFDFDIESITASPAQESYGWATLINHMKRDLFPLDHSKPYYISGAAPCLDSRAFLALTLNQQVLHSVYCQIPTFPTLSPMHGTTLSSSSSTTRHIAQHALELPCWMDHPKQPDGTSALMGGLLQHHSTLIQRFT